MLVLGDGGAEGDSGLDGIAAAEQVLPALLAALEQWRFRSLPGVER